MEYLFRFEFYSSRTRSPRARPHPYDRAVFLISFDSILTVYFNQKIIEDTAIYVIKKNYGVMCFVFICTSDRSELFVAIGSKSITGPREPGVVHTAASRLVSLITRVRYCIVKARRTAIFVKLLYGDSNIYLIRVCVCLF